MPRALRHEYPGAVYHVMARGKGPGWLVFDRLLAAFDLAKDGRGRRAYVAWLEERAADGGDGIGPEAMAALKRGWYLGEASFAEKLRKLADPARAALEALAAAAYGQDVLSLEQVRRLLGLESMWDAKAVLSKHGAWPSIEVDDLREDLAVLRSLRKGA